MDLSTNDKREPKCNLKGTVLDPDTGWGLPDRVVTATSIAFGHTYEARTDSSGSYTIPVPGPLAASPIAYSVTVDLQTDPPSQTVDVNPGCDGVVNVDTMNKVSAYNRGSSGE